MCMTTWMGCIKLHKVTEWVLIATDTKIFFRKYLDVDVQVLLCLSL